MLIQLCFSNTPFALECRWNSIPILFTAWFQDVAMLNNLFALDTNCEHISTKPPSSTRKIRTLTLAKIVLGKNNQANISW